MGGKGDQLSHARYATRRSRPNSKSRCYYRVRAHTHTHMSLYQMTRQGRCFGESKFWKVRGMLQYLPTTPPSTISPHPGDATTAAECVINRSHYYCWCLAVRAATFQNKSSSNGAANCKSKGPCYTKLGRHNNRVTTGLLTLPW